MNAIQVSKFGGPEVLQLTKAAPVPKPGPGQVLVQVKAAGVNPVDTYIRDGQRGGQLPYIPGKDGAGIVAELGSNVTRAKPGDRVYFFLSSSGTYAEYCLVDEKCLAPLKEQLSFSQGAAIGVPYYTAYRALVHKANVKPGDTVLIHGASGAVGLACCQIGRQLGCNIFGTAGTKEGMALAKANGAKMVFNHKDTDYMEKITKASGEVGVSAVIEMLANLNLAKDCELLRPCGKVVIVGSRGSLDFNPRLTMGKELTIIGLMVLNASTVELEETVAFLGAGQEAGWLTPVVDKEFALEKAAESHREVISHAGGSQGKIVLCVEPAEGLNSVPL
ncbi:hypothetical protein CAPTEDRAFT_151197 [Capitella teleta]|uniref:Enoyl reductase (ER) domain-containing protein n=1 Tax=Capitella teleta TaxID=283909 RepID=R7TLC1_CAPTE|nr:hypothetical protein CAPTEDRAFT_151197 [Capitella teleta]|eukprot:ELT92331.1 hypothetical protein CAPTEDRAFT_151197 [Capitella teleta]